MGALRTALRRALAGGLVAGCCSIAHGAGATILTHGWNPNSDYPVWMEAMRTAIKDHGLNGDARLGTMTVTRSGGALAVACDPWDILPSGSSTGEILVVLDWSAVANHLTGGPPVQDVAAVVVEAIVDGQHGQRPLAERPLHLIGHSRGGALVGELARRLGEHGLVVDQVTFLDPHPLTVADPQPPLLPTVLDVPVSVFENVVFADAYSQTNEYPKGQYVEGACNRLWGGLPGGYHPVAPVAADHQNIHLMYHGTVKLENPVHNGEAVMGAAERAVWFNEFESSGEKTGFAFSRLAGREDRSSLHAPVPGGDAVRSGLNAAALMGGTGSRSALAWAQAVWPNVAHVEVLWNGVPMGRGTHALTNGTPLAIRVVSLDFDSGYEVELRLDIDTCPYNGNDIAVLSTQNFAVGTGTHFVETLEEWIAASAGDHPAVYVCARVSDGERTRYVYAAPALTWFQETGGWDDGWQNLGDGWRRLGWLGDYAPLGNWIWHNQHGFWYPAAGSLPADVWFYAQDMGWLWTGNTVYPFLYRAGDDAWLWYNGSANPRWFRNMTAGSWEWRP